MGAGKAFGNLLQEYNLDEEEFVKILEKTNTIPAGGALLSVYLKNNNIKSFESFDLDLFIKNDNIENIEKLKYFIENSGYKKFVNKNLRIHYKNNNIENIIQYHNNVNNKIIQIIIVKEDVEEYIKNFDLDICQTYYLNKKIITNAKNVLELKANLNANYITNSTYERTLKYINRGFKIYYQDNDISELCKFVIYAKEFVNPEMTKNFFIK